jgi:hypothetical protein
MARKSLAEHGQFCKMQRHNPRRGAGAALPHADAPGRRSCWGIEQMQLRATAAALALTAAMTATAAPAGSIEEMSGYWSGNGSVVLASGNTERVKCAVTYKVNDGGTQIKQSMRCASADYNINASADLNVKGQSVTGSWEEKTYSAVGEVTGRYSGSNMTLSIKGATFTAAMNLTLSNCKQSISITPLGLDVTRISIGLQKC